MDNESILYENCHRFMTKEKGSYMKVSNEWIVMDFFDKFPEITFVLSLIEFLNF